MQLTILKRQKLGWEISISLLLKFAIIFFLWWIFFSDPVDEDLTGPDVGNVLFGKVVNKPVDTANQSLITREK